MFKNHNWNHPLHRPNNPLPQPLLSSPLLSSSAKFTSLIFDDLYPSMKNVFYSQLIHSSTHFTCFLNRTSQDKYQSLFHLQIRTHYLSLFTLFSNHQSSLLWNLYLYMDLIHYIELSLDTKDSHEFLCSTNLCCLLKLLAELNMFLWDPKDTTYIQVLSHLVISFVGVPNKWPTKLVDP